MFFSDNVKIFLFVFCYLIFSPLVSYSGDTSECIFTPEEQLFIQNQPVVIGIGKHWQPYVKVDSAGNVSSFEVDLINKINTLAGTNFKIVADDWTTVVEKVKNGELDGLCGGPAHEERKSFLNFTDTYASLGQVLLVARGNHLGIHSEDDVNGRTIVYVKGNLFCEKYCRNFPESKVLVVDTYKELVESIASGKADVTFGNGVTLNVATLLNMPYLQIASPMKEPMPLVFGIRKEFSRAVNIINKAMSLISSEEIQALRLKWAVDLYTEPNEPQDNLQLSESERKYLKEIKSISACTVPDWLPYANIGSDGKFQGVAAEFMTLISDKLGIKIEPVVTERWADSLKAVEERRCDVITTAVPTPERKKYMFFTQKLFDVPIIIATKHDEFYIDDIQAKLDKKFVAVKKFAVVELLRNKYPEIAITEVSSGREALQMVSSGEAFGYIGTLGVVSHIIQHNYYSDLTITGELDETFSLSIGVRNDDPVLFSILDKAVRSISKEDKQAIVNKYLAIKYEQRFDYTLFWRIVVVFALIIALILYRYQIVSRYNSRLKESEERYRGLYDTVRSEKRKTEKALDAERKAIQQNLNFIDMISHEYRTPLSVISSSLDLVELSYPKKEYPQLTEQVEDMREATERLLKLFEFSIHDEMVDEGGLHELELVSVSKLVSLASGFFYQVYPRHRIVIENVDQGLRVAAYYTQMITAISNVIDNACKYSEAGSVVTISAGRSEKKLLIRISDSGRGISAEEQPHIFEKYYRSENVGDRKGSGVGLFLVKKIMDMHNGSIDVVSKINRGTVITLNLPLDSPE